MTEKHSLIPSDRIEQAILIIRGYKVMLDKDLAALYGVTTGMPARPWCTLDILIKED